MRNALQEVRELGLHRTAARISWELKLRAGLLRAKPIRPIDAALSDGATLTSVLPFSNPDSVRRALAESIPPGNMATLVEDAANSAEGRIVCFGRWLADFGNPIDWSLNPVTQQRWDSLAHWSTLIRQPHAAGDIKLTWEVGRFPHAFRMARAAAFSPADAPRFSAALCHQIESFRRANPFGMGVHWASGQEIAIRFCAFLFALSVFSSLGQPVGSISKVIAAELLDGAVHLERHIDYARKSVYNNHLLSEALGLYIAGWALPDAPEASHWRELGSVILTEQADLQVRRDGGYIQNSHNYHRFAMQVYLLGWALETKYRRPPEPWRAAMERSLNFLFAHQNLSDGRLPNYGANDGSLPLVLSTCDYSDFRPTLQALSLATRGKRIYSAGPWDEESAWLFGPQVLDAPLCPLRPKSISFSCSGYHVLRGGMPDTFGAFRCGTVVDRFSQIDMLHLDVWWRGHNVFVDSGSYLYNGPEEWHNHFLRTGSHNTIQVDGRDQMHHFRKFKCLYWTRAKLLRFEDNPDWALCEGEHYGYQRHPGRCVHRRSVLFLKDDLWVVVDRIEGSGTHHVRLHWLGGDFPYRTGFDERTSLQLETSDGPFYLAVFNAAGKPLSRDIVTGESDPPRGWLSRYYGEKVPVPSLSAEVSERLPLIMVSILGAHVPSLSVTGSTWSVTAGDRVVEFELNADGIIQPRLSTPAPIPA